MGRKIQKQGLTPAVLENYLSAGWPIAAIATDRHLDEEDVLNAMKRWDICKRATHTPVLN